MAQQQLDLTQPKSLEDDCPVEFNLEAVVGSDLPYAKASRQMSLLFSRIFVQEGTTFKRIDPIDFIIKYKTILAQIADPVRFKHFTVK